VGVPEPTFDKTLIEEVLTELALLARAQGKVIEIAIYGGSALTLVSNFRISTRDVDAVADDDGQLVIEMLAKDVAKRRGWSETWLNDEIFPFLSDSVDGIARNHHTYYRSYPSEQDPGLRVFVPTPEYLLAMKLMAMRIGIEGSDKDRLDILNLLSIVGLSTQDDILDFVTGFYPEANKSAKVLRGIVELLKPNINGGPSPDALAPRYLGRSGAPRERG
jgi:hypothetical protein